ncbi:MAG: DNA-3-methyladenine glycosylase 2 family protein [Cyanobacteria bacterium HKST-UBA02]|nr:DNA-3-methyladenine glycosylase 2 family protein [Cyanobacteria bacterium HKST-UBA02]
MTRARIASGAGSVTAGSAHSEALLEEAVAELKRKDRVLGKAMESVGPCLLTLEKTRSPYESLARAIVYQQLTGKAAGTIFERFKARFQSSTCPTAEAVARASEEELRSCGLSRAKIRALKDLADKTARKEIPGFSRMSGLTDQEIIEIASSVRGVGVWTAQMFLIFRLGRLDVMPSTDYGVRKGYSRVFLKEKRLPEPSEIDERGERWRPYRSIASWYLWRVLDN